VLLSVKAVPVFRCWVQDADSSITDGGEVDGTVQGAHAYGVYLGVVQKTNAALLAGSKGSNSAGLVVARTSQEGTPSRVNAQTAIYRARCPARVRDKVVPEAGFPDPDGLIGAGRSQEGGASRRTRDGIYFPSCRRGAGRSCRSLGPRSARSVFAACG